MSQDAKMTKNNALICLLVMLSLLNACSSNSRYSMKQDKAPQHHPELANVEDAHPRYEPYSRGGNRSPYTVLGKSYTVLDTGQNYKEQGIASWYGEKFHGHLTSNGETYDMFSMSAAHKSLPLPSYVRVTNLANNKQVIVRVNDRGPFHHQRLIDLSYAAAYRLDMLKTGTAEVQLEVIYFPNPSTVALDTLINKKNSYVQVLASSNRAKLDELGKKLSAQYQLNYRLKIQNQLFKLQLGPFKQQELAIKVSETLKTKGYPKAYIISEPAVTQ